MIDKNRKEYIRQFAAILGTGIVIGTASFILAGCARTGVGEMARELHSLSPCGMMMEAMTGHGHGEHSSGERPVEKEPQMNPETIPDSQREVGHYSPASPGMEL